MGMIIAGILLVAATLTLVRRYCKCLPEGKHWPNFSCYPYNASAHQQMYTNHHGMGWDSCHTSYKKYQGKCDKVCVLRSRNVLIRTYHNGPFTIDTNAFVALLADELGISINNPDSSQKEIMNNVTSALEECKQKHPEYATLTVKNTPCEPWENVTRCIDQATGCGEK